MVIVFFTYSAYSSSVILEARYTLGLYISNYVFEEPYFLDDVRLN